MPTAAVSARPPAPPRRARLASAPVERPHEPYAPLLIRVQPVRRVRGNQASSKALLVNGGHDATLCRGRPADHRPVADSTTMSLEATSCLPMMIEWPSSVQPIPRMRGAPVNSISLRYG